MNKPSRLICLVIFLSINSFSEAQEANLRAGSVSVFIDCEYCDLDHLKREINWVNYVREPKEADVHILIAEETTGSKGTKYSLFFIGQKKFSTIHDTITYNCLPDDTEDIQRERMVKNLKLGLLQYIKNTPLSDYISIDLILPESDDEVTDKWNSWVFRLSTSGYINGDKNYNQFNIWSSVSADRVTEKFKTETSLDHSYSESNFDYDGYMYKSLNRSYSLMHQDVYSLNDHWSAGYWVGGLSSTFSNIKLKYYFNPALEYNIFPYKESTRKQIRINYNIGPNQHFYNDTTIYNKINEVVFDQTLNIAAEFVQKWGRIWLNASYVSYLHDLSLNRLSFNTSLNLRIAKGLEFSIYAGYSIIHNQITLPKGDATQEELLLQQRELKTEYSFWGNAGITYTFGNLYNNVVNPRFGN
jgi:hypothetical protein